MVMMKSSLLLLASTPLCSSWTMASTSRQKLRMNPEKIMRPERSGALFSTVEDGAVNIVSLEGLTSHEEEGALLATSIAKWLDAEWMPQKIHVAMAESAKQSYVQARQAGEADIMSVMLRVADDLRANWKLYDKEAFVNEWDVANYCSDYFTQRSGNEACDCSTKIF